MHTQKLKLSICGILGEACGTTGVAFVDATNPATVTQGAMTATNCTFPFVYNNEFYYGCAQHPTETEHYFCETTPGAYEFCGTDPQGDVSCPLQRKCIVLPDLLRI